MLKLLVKQQFIFSNKESLRIKRVKYLCNVGVMSVLISQNLDAGRVRTSEPIVSITLMGIIRIIYKKNCKKYLHTEI